LRIHADDAYSLGTDVRILIDHVESNDYAVESYRLPVSSFFAAKWEIITEDEEDIKAVEL
jgi:hypothetical protein